MKAKVINLLRRTLGTAQLIDRLEQLERRLQALAENARGGGREAGALSNEGLKILPGTEYSQYAIPLDYMPSRAFSPRYGYSHGKIDALARWFEEHNDSYFKFLSYMRALDVQHIPTQLSSGSALAPAWIGGAICAFDSLALYAMVRKYQPKVYLEIGSGMTTCFAKQAMKDAEFSTKLISIDPQPRREVDAICDEVIRDGLETCDLSVFDQLEAGDILFFDGSHRSFMNSDVTVFFIDVLPRVKPGVIIHVHDILLPWDYPESFKNWYWNEQYLLAIYLMNAQDDLVPLLPTTWICRSGPFENEIVKPFVDLGSQDSNQSWRGGGSMWFTKR